MREIKFRFWTGIEMRQPNLNTFLLSTNGSAWWQFGYDDIEPIPDWIPMQYTGLKDKNGVKLYEGDVIKIFWNVGESTCETIGYDEKYGYWKYGNNPICELLDPATEFEVIGNIHENPELL